MMLDPYPHPRFEDFLRAACGKSYKEVRHQLPSPPTNTVAEDSLRDWWRAHGPMFRERIAAKFLESDLYNGLDSHGLSSYGMLRIAARAFFVSKKSDEGYFVGVLSPLYQESILWPELANDILEMLRIYIPLMKDLTRSSPWPPTASPGRGLS